MQIMQATFEEIARTLPVSDRSDPRHRIAAGIYDDRILYDQWEIPDLRERLAFTFASYNAGSGRIRQAQERCDAQCGGWNAVAPYAPTETLAYVARIFDLMNATARQTRSAR